MGNKFGSGWTEKKLEVLKKYLNFYMTALKKTKFKKIYIDCFAGSGSIELRDNKIINGSAKIALELDNKFDEYYFIEQNEDNFNELETLAQNYEDLKITIIKGDCNEELPKLLDKFNWKSHRSVLFIDPYATQFKFDTLKIISNTKAIDVWYLFPFSAVNRLLTKNCNMDKSWEDCISNCLGTNQWKSELYQCSPQLNFFNEEEKEKLPTSKIQEYICSRMQSIFSYVPNQYIDLRNDKNSTLFLLFLLVSNDSEKAHKIIKNVVKYILK